MTTLSDFSDHEDEILAEYEREDVDEDHKNLSDIDTKEQEENVPRKVDPSTSRVRITRNPIPTLNTQRLKGPKGIHTIEKHFEGFKFHGKGHEKMDLDRVMKRMEHWAHRLFPKLHFDDFLEKVEKLGTKKDLTVFVTKYRKDMVTPDEDETPKTNITDDECVEDNAAIDAFDLLIAEQIEKQKEALVQHNLDKNDTNDISHSNIFEQHATKITEKTIEVSNSQKTSELSDEIKERIERNRQQAIERKLAKLKAMKEDTKKKETEENKDIEM
ncbi:hypothetical protein KPH14_007774 [Odynerus spinipes]|uniref:TIMELESS-interacting protein n=1 Tax=Odynerus spinipes TaxID=1348599 RepID=A0AAD9RJ19_9HYME|nr:hypothetical protein KPH14_007774 [Odynerus spinipes]